MFGLTLEKLILIAVVAAFIIGPAKLPLYAAKLAKLVQAVKGYTATARERVREEMGPEFDDVDWKKLDPRQYDPRRIIRDALIDGVSTSGTSTTDVSPAPVVTPTIVPPASDVADAQVTNVKQIEPDTVQMKQAN